MKILVMTDIEGVTGVTTFPQAEKSEFGREMLMNDLCAVLQGIKDAGAEAVVYDMHTDGRNVDISMVDYPVVMGKPILPKLYRGVGSDFDGCDHLPAGITGVDGWAKVYTALAERGYSKRLLDDIFYNNLMRVVRNICDM